ncbi:GNAT family N-acetyltransferase [Archangium violaceum]|uniref:GNAT family N-acetyltransferase n=1 Tax=Archangium violaceum TaxID=83451 RepID=UPI0037BFA16A
MKTGSIAGEDAASLGGANLELRTALPEDYPGVGALLVEVYVGGGFSPAERAPVLRAVEPLAADGELIVARDERGGLMGTVTFLLSGSRHVELAREHEAELRLLAVAPAARGRGIGEALVTECIRRARDHGCQRLVLSTQPTMAPAQRLYMHAGFVRAPERDWSKAGSPRLAFTLELARATYRRSADS